jgi:excisionase family DNA binding protein
MPAHPEFASDRSSVSQVARRLGVHPSTVARWLADGVVGVRLPAKRIGGRYFITEADLAGFLDAINPEVGDAPHTRAAAEGKARQRCEDAGI